MRLVTLNKISIHKKTAKSDPTWAFQSIAKTIKKKKLQALLKKEQLEGDLRFVHKMKWYVYEKQVKLRLTTTSRAKQYLVKLVLIN